MKKLISACLLGVITLSSCSTQFDNRSKIRVSGSAETEVLPDIIYFGISLREYFRSPGNKNKQDMKTLEKQLQNAVLRAGIPASDFTINNVASYNYEWERKKNPGFLMRKQYRIKVKDLSKLNSIINSLEPRSIEYTNIEGYDYSKMESVKKDVKIKALRAAKNKAAYLAEAANSTLGEAIEIDELNNSSSYPQRVSNTMMDGAAVEQSSSAMPVVDFRKIKLTYQINMVFELK